MKKLLKIVLYIIGSTLFLVVIALIFHNIIISHTLKSIISDKSEGKISLQLNNVDLNLRTGSIIINKPELSLDEVYLDKSNNMQIDRIVFEKIEIGKVNLQKLIFNRSIEAVKLFIDKPEFWFTEMGKNAKSEFQPEKLLAVLNQDSNIFGSLQIKIDQVAIHYGFIKIFEQKSTEMERDVADFTFILNKFNSHAHDSAQKRILFSEELSFKLYTLSRKLKSGYILKIDSAIFNSTRSNLRLGGASLEPTIENIDDNRVGLYAKQLIITDIGLQEVQGLEELSMQAIHLSDGNLTTYQNIIPKKQADSANLKGVEQLKKIFAEFKLDSISINRFAFQNIVKGKDTTITAKDINFLITGVRIDSGMFDNPFKKFVYDTIKFGTASLVLDQVIRGYRVQYNKLNYSNYDRNLKISAIHIAKDSTADGIREMDISLRELDVKGFSLKRFQKQLSQRLSVHLIGPDISLSMNKKNTKNKNTRNLIFPNHLELEEVIVQNGNLNITIHDKSEIAINDLDLNVEDFYFPDKKNNEIRFQSLNFNYQSLIAQFEGNKYQLTTGASNYSDQQLMLRKINGGLSVNDKTDPLLLSSDYLVLSEFNLERLLFDKQLIIGNLIVNKPVITGAFQMLQENEHSKNNADKQNQTIPLTFNIGGVHINDGLIDASIDSNEEELNLLTAYDVKIGELSVNKGDSINSLLRQFSWDVQLHNSAIKYLDHELRMKSLVSNSYSSKFRLDSLSVQSNSQFASKHNKLEVKNLGIPLLEFISLDYKLLLVDDSLDIGSLELDGLKLDVILPEAKKDQVQIADPNQKFNLRDYLFFTYDTILLSRMHLNIEKPGDSSHQVFQFENLHIGHQRKGAKGLNLIRNIGFEFESFLFTDTISNKYLKIQKGFADPGIMSFTIQGVEGSNLSQKNGKASDQFKSSTTFTSSQIKFDEIFIKEELPSRMKVGKLSIDNLDLDLQSFEKADTKSTKNSSFKINLELLKRFTNLITRLEVDSAQLNEFSLTYRSENDTATEVFTADSIAFIVNDFNIDTAMIGQTDPQIIKKLSIDLHGRTHITSDSLYEIKTGRLNYDFPNHQISLDSLYVTPRYTDSIFFKKSIFQTDRLILFGKRIEVNDIDFDSFLNNKIIHFGSIHFYEFDVDMYRDKRFPWNPEVRPALPREALMKINQKFLIDSILLTNSHLTYQEFDVKSEHPGKIFFSDINLNGYQFTNILKENNRETVFNVDITAKIMGESGINLSVHFPIYPDTTAFWIRGKTEEIDLVSVNSMTENLIGISVTRGKGIIDIPLLSANDSIASGTVLFKYKKLKLGLYNRKKEHLDKGFFSPLANLLINDLVRSNNPKFARKPVVGISYFKRDIQKGVVNYAWKGLLTGIISTLGVNNKNQRKQRKIQKKTP